MAPVVDATAVEDAATLVGVDKYRFVTGDTETIAGDVSDALGLALEVVEEYLGRRLALDEYTETLPVLKYRVYPTHTPVVAATGYLVRGNALVVGWENWDTSGTYATITYTGGYDATTLPTRLAMAICNLAQSFIEDAKPATESAVPEGITSIGLGDLRVTYGNSTGASSGTKELPADIRQSIRAYKKQRV